MKKLKTEVEEQISNLSANFLKEQLGEQAISVITILSNDMFTIRATNCLPPGGQNLVQNEKHWDLLQKSRYVSLKCRIRIEETDDASMQLSKV